MRDRALQINPTVGDLAGNARLILERAARGARAGRRPRRDARSWRWSATCRAICCSSAGFVRRSWDVLGRAGARGRRPAAGARRPAGTEPVRRRTAALQHRGAAARRPRRSALPQGAAADLRRVRRGPLLRAVSRRRRCSTSAAARLGISICEDIWNDRDFWKRRRYHHDPIEELVARRRHRHRQPVGVAVHRRQAPAARRDARQHGAQAPRAGRLRESVRRQRRSRVRRPQLRVQRRRRADRARTLVRRRRRHLRSRRRSADRAARGRGRRVGNLARAGARHARLRAQVRLHAASCSVSRAASTRRSPPPSPPKRSARERARRADAVAVFEPRQHRRRAAAGREPRHRDA